MQYDEKKKKKKKQGREKSKERERERAKERESKKSRGCVTNRLSALFMRNYNGCMLGYFMNLETISFFDRSTFD